MRDLTQHADTLGFETLFAVEHAVVAQGYMRKYPYNPKNQKICNCS